MRPARQVEETASGYHVQYSGGFTTQDRALAEAVAIDLDRREPLPCGQHDWLEITTISSAHGQWICAGCGETRRGERPERMAEAV